MMNDIGSVEEQWDNTQETMKQKREKDERYRVI